MQEATIVASTGNGSTDLHVASYSEVNPKTVLKKNFGYDSFRPGQLDGINAVFKQQDAIILIPIGRGEDSNLLCSNNDDEGSYSCYFTLVDAHARSSTQAA